MVTRILRMLATYLAFLTLQYAVAKDIHLYVSPTGSDSNDGQNITIPVKTIYRALSLAGRSQYKNNTKIIELMPGYHDLTRTVGISVNNLVIRSYQKQEVHMTGGRRVPSSAFKEVTDQSILSKFTPDARKHVRVAHLPDVHMTNYGKTHVYGSGMHRTAGLEVSFNGRAMELARWPNEGYIDITATPDGSAGDRFRYNSSVPKSWLNESDPWIHGFLHYTYFEEGLPVSDLNVNEMMVTLGHHPLKGLRAGHWKNQPLRNPNTGGFFAFVNILSELDEAGEYYLDKSHGNLYIWVPNNDGHVKPTDVVYASMIDNCFVIQSSAKNVTLQDFTIESCRRYGLVGHHLTDVKLLNLEVRNTGAMAMYITDDNRNVRIANSLIHDTDAGIHLNGGNREKLESSGNIIEDNEIYRYTRVTTRGMRGVEVYGVGHIVRHNHFHDSGSAAITFQGNDNLMENNLIHDVSLEQYTGSAIITPRDFTARGNIIRSNIVHDIRGLDIPNAWCSAINVDSHSSGNIITNNVFYNNDIHVSIAGGRDNEISDNVMYNATLFSVSASKRSSSTNEILQLLNQLHKMPYHDTDWALRYPDLVNIDSTNYSLPEDNQISGNIVYIEGKAQFVHIHQGSVNSPKFFNVTNVGYSIGPSDHFNVNHGDYRVKCSAADWANKNNFQQVPSPNDVGPRKAPVGPMYLHHGQVQTVTLASSSSVCTTNAPATKSPVSSYLPDGSDTHHIFNVSNEGHTGTFRDMYGERFQRAGQSEKMCFERAVAEWTACGRHAGETVAAIYGPTGAMTYAGDGCFIAQYGCPLHGGPSDGHAITTGKVVRDVVAETNHSGKTSESGCLSHALEYWKYCGSSPNHPVTSIYRPTGATRTAGAGCWIHTDKCPSHPEYKSMFYDAWGSTNRHTDAIQQACLGQAEYYWHLCGSDRKVPVTAYYRPTTVSKTFP